MNFLKQQQNALHLSGPSWPFFLMGSCATATNEQAIGLVQKILENYSEAPFKESNKEQEYRCAASSVAEVVKETAGDTKTDPGTPTVNGLGRL